MDNIIQMGSGGWTRPGASGVWRNGGPDGWEICFIFHGRCRRTEDHSCASGYREEEDPWVKEMVELAGYF